jgi:16S rRNA (cytosine967-C5)-methyltransferase
LNSKKFFNGSNSGKTNHNHAKKTNDTYTQKETKPHEKIESKFSQNEPKYAGKTNRGTVKYVNPRQISYLILNRYFSENSNLKSLLNEFLKKYSLLELDRRFIYEVVKGTVRYVIRIDFLISLFSNKNITSLDKDVLNILRQAVYQILYMDKTPGYAAVYESVEIAKKLIGTYSSRFVNAVLRKINSVPKIEEFLENSIKNTFRDPAERLSVKYSYPKWIADYWIKSFGAERTELLFRSLNCEPQVFIRVNRLKTDKKKLINAFKESGMQQGHDFFSEPLDNIETADGCEMETSAYTSFNLGNKSKIKASSDGNTGLGDNHEITADSICEMGSFKKTCLYDDCIVLKSVQNIEKVPGYLQGHFSIQDFSSQFAVKYFLDPAKHDRILDICGAPGGKATYMAEFTENDAEIVSVDINIKKLDLFQENIERLGIKNISLINADATETDFLRQDKFENYFDKIFIDAPCSALGTISKNPDAKYANTLLDMERLGEITWKMLSAVDRYLKPGGIIILYKCTLSEIENQASVKKFIEQNPGKYQIEYPFSNYTDIFASAEYTGSRSVLQESRKAGEGVNLKKDNILQLAAWFGPLLKKAPLFEIMPDYFSSEAGFVCILKKLA